MPWLNMIKTIPNDQEHPWAWTEEEKARSKNVVVTPDYYWSDLEKENRWHAKMDAEQPRRPLQTYQQELEYLEKYEGRIRTTFQCYPITHPEKLKDVEYSVSTVMKSNFDIYTYASGFGTFCKQSKTRTLMLDNFENLIHVARSYRELLKHFKALELEKEIFRTNCVKLTNGFKKLKQKHKEEIQDIYTEIYDNCEDKDVKKHHAIVFKHSNVHICKRHGCLCNAFD